VKRFLFDHVQRSIYYTSSKRPGLDETSASSYQPISNLSVLSKLLERLVGHQLTVSDACWPPLIFPVWFSTGSFNQNCHSANALSYSLGCRPSRPCCSVPSGPVSTFDMVDHSILLQHLQQTFVIGDAVLLLSVVPVIQETVRMSKSQQVISDLRDL